MIKKDTYVADIQGGGNSIESLYRFKMEAIWMMVEAGFRLHKWHSNVRGLELDKVFEELMETPIEATDSIWNTMEQINGCPRITFHTLHQGIGILIKRKIILTTNSLYDEFSWVAPITITGKLIFSDVCNKNLTWDEPVPPDVEKRWKY